MKKNKRRKQVYEKILSIFAWLAFVLSLIMAILTIFSSFSDETNGKEIFKRKFLIVQSDSMSRSTISENEKIFFNTGDIVVIKTNFNTSDFKEGDVISFFSYNQDSYGKTLTHKIRSVKRNANGVLIGYETYGINTGISDGALVVEEAIIGQYVGKIKGIGNIFSFLKTPQGYYLSVLIPLVLLIVFFSIKVGKYLGERAGAIEDNAQSIVHNAEGIEHNAEEIEHNAQGVEDNALKIKELRERILTLEQKFFELSGVLIRSTTNEAEQALLSNAQNTENNNGELVSTKDFEFSLLKINKVSFSKKFLNLDSVSKDYFYAIHNELLSYKKVRDRLSFKGISYRLGRKLLAKVTIRGKTLKLNLALNVNDFNKNVYFQKDLSNLKTYQDVPFSVKVKSERGKKNALKLIESLMVNNGVKKIKDK